MSQVDKSCKDFVDALAAKVPVPGGGGAAALGGAIGMALSTMVGNFTMGKKKYAEAESEIRELIKKGLEIQADLIHLVDKDGEAFEPLSKAYGLPTETEEQKKVKSDTLERESQNAIAVSLEIVRKAYEGIKIHERMGEIGSKLLISDIGCGVVFLRSALIAGKLNVVINLNLIKDIDFVCKTKEEVDGLEKEGIKIADKMYQSILGQIS